MKKKILIIYTSAGHGHYTAAKALEEAFLDQYSESVDLKLVDALDYTHLVYKEVYSKSYLAMANYAPKLWGLLYYKSDKNVPGDLHKHLVKQFDKLNAIKLTELVKKFEPDHIISTHFLPAEILSPKKYQIKHFHHSVVITDYEVHSFWIRRGVDTYFVGNNEAKWVIEERAKVKPENVHAFGIPVSLKYLEKVSKDVFLKSEKLDPKAKTLLFLCGGFGIGDISKYVKAVGELNIPINLICVTGKNKRLENKLREIDLPRKINKKIHGFVTNMNEFISSADLVVSKPGGLTTSECLALSTPMLLTLPIPGQEDGNTDFLVEHGAAIRGKDPLTFKYRVKCLLEDPERLLLMERSASKIGKPNAANDIVKEILKK